MSSTHRMTVLRLEFGMRIWDIVPSSPSGIDSIVASCYTYLQPLACWRLVYDLPNSFDLVVRLTGTGTVLGDPNTLYLLSLCTTHGSGLTSRTLL